MSKKETEEKVIENEVIDENAKLVEEQEKEIKEFEKKQKRDRNQKIILIIIIIILLLLHWLLCGKLGKIGFGENIFTSTDLFGNSTTINGSDALQNTIDSTLNGKLMDVIELVDGDVNVVKGDQLNIFKNETFNNEKMIAPGSYGKYVFCVKNLTHQNISYDISFLDEMTNKVNMKYKLKIDNIYIKGDKDTYVTVDDLNVEDIIVVKDSINMFTLEWYWDDVNDIQDTYVGTRKETQTYTLNLKILSELYNKEENNQ